MDTLLAAADNLNDLLDEFEKNEEEPVAVHPMQASQDSTGKVKFAATSSASNPIQDESNIISVINDPSNITTTENIDKIGSNDEGNEGSEFAEAQSQNCEDLMAKSEELMNRSLKIEASTKADTSSVPSPDTVMNVFDALPDSFLKSDMETPTTNILFSPLNPFSASYSGPVAAYEGENIFPVPMHIADGDIVESSAMGNPFPSNNIGTVDENQPIADELSNCVKIASTPLSDFNEENVQSVDVENHVESLPNLSDTIDSGSSTNDFSQPSSLGLSADNTKVVSDAGLKFPLPGDVNESGSVSLNTAVKSTEITPVATGMNDISILNFKPDRQETNSMGFMRDVEISKEEFDRFWEQVEDDINKPSHYVEDHEIDIATAVKPTLTHEQTLLDCALSRPITTHNIDLENARIQSDTEEVVVSATSCVEPCTAATVVEPDASAPSQPAVSTDLLIQVPSVLVSEPDNFSNDRTVSSEVMTSPVSVPFTPNRVSPHGSPTFPLRRKITDPVTQEDVTSSEEGQAEASNSECLGSEANRLSLNVDERVDENVDIQRYPATPPPPYSEEMHVNYEQAISPTSATANSGPQQSTRQFSHEETEDMALLAIMESITRPGETKPVWIPDQDAPQCSNCAQKFTFTRRRHHCRACGRVFCANCCSERAQLKYLEFKEARVCLMCCLAIKQADAVAAQIASQRSQPGRAVSNAPTPQQEIVDPVQSLEQPAGHNTPADAQYHAEIVPAPSQMETAQGSNGAPSQEDLEVEGATAGSATVKSVRFSDGTRPTHPDETPTTPPPPTRTSRLRKRHSATIDQTDFDSTTLPPAVIAHGEDGTFAVQNDPDNNVLLGLLESGNQNPQTFVLNPNLFVHVKFVSYANRQCWCYWSEGMDSVGQREVVLVLERQGLGDRQISSDAFMLYKYIFDRARKGKIFNTSDYMPKSVMGVQEAGELFNIDRNAGFLFVQATSQPLEGLSCLRKKLYSHLVSGDNVSNQFDHPINGMLFAILVQKTEAPLATLFPMRLMLRLGIETKQYPCPLFSIRQRDPVFREIGHTILAILCDFNNFKYRIIGVPGIRVVLSTNGHISVQIPCNRFRDMVRIMNSSNESVLAIGTGTYGPKLIGANSTSSIDAPCDSHLVCVQDHETTSYHTEISSMKNVKPMNTGAAFVIFNGSLKSDNSHFAKCAIVEDGIMIQLLPEKMTELRSCLKSMEDFSVQLAANSQNIPDQNTSEGNHVEQLFLEVKWVDDDTAFNIGMFSPIDGTPFEGIVGFNVQGRSEQKGKKFILRWNQVFFLASTGNPLDLSRLAEQVANGCFKAFTPVIQELVKHRLLKIGVRVTIHPENVCYVAGGGQKDLPLACMNSLDEHLIQTIHSAANSVPAEQEAVVFELLFSVLLTKPSYRTA